MIKSSKKKDNPELEKQINVIDRIKEGNLEKFKSLIQSDPTIINKIVNEEGDTPLHIACLEEKIDLVELLIKRGADINASNKSGLSPLHYASTNSSVLSLLLKKKKLNVNSTCKSGNTILHHVASKPAKIDLRHLEILLKVYI